MSDGIDQARRPGLILRYLTHTHPAMIFVHAIAVLLISPFVIAMDHWLQASHADYADMLRMTLAGSDDIHFSMSDDRPVNPLRGSLVWIIRLASRLLGVLGYALPLWAVARLIADALRDKPRTPTLPPM